MKNLTTLILATILITLGLPACATPLPVGSITFTWDCPTAVEDGVIGFRLLRMDPGSTNWVQQATTPVGTLTTTVEKPMWGAIYAVLSYDDIGNTSEMSNTWTNRFGVLPTPVALHGKR